MGAYFEEKRSGPAQVCDVIKEAEAPKDPGWSNKGGRQREFWGNTTGARRRMLDMTVREFLYSAVGE
jgi:hypothetical protein